MPRFKSCVLFFITAMLGVTKFAHAGDSDPIPLTLNVQPGDKFHTTKTITKNGKEVKTEINWVVLPPKKSDEILIEFSENGNVTKRQGFGKDGNWGTSSEWGYDPVGPLVMQFNVEYDQNYNPKPANTKVGSKWTLNGGNTRQTISLTWQVTSRKSGIMTLNYNLKRSDTASDKVLETAKGIITLDEATGVVKQANIKTDKGQTITINTTAVK